MNELDGMRHGVKVTILARIGDIDAYELGDTTLDSPDSSHATVAQLLRTIADEIEAVP